MKNAFYIYRNHITHMVLHAQILHGDPVRMRGTIAATAHERHCVGIVSMVNRFNRSSPNVNTLVLKHVEIPLYDPDRDRYENNINGCTYAETKGVRVFGGGIGDDRRGTYGTSLVIGENRLEFGGDQRVGFYRSRTVCV